MLRRSIYCFVFLASFLFSAPILTIASGKYFLLQISEGEKIILSLSKNQIDRAEFARNFKSVFFARFIPRAAALTKMLFPLFKADLLADIYEVIIDLFKLNKKEVWMYVGNKKEDFFSVHLDLLATELLCYLEYLEKKNIKQAWFKEKNNPRYQEIYYELVIMAFCYQTRRMAAIILLWKQNYKTIMKLAGDPYRKAYSLVNKLKGSPFREQATDILKNYEGVIALLSNKYSRDY